jgi:hypothetical protein
MVDLKDGPNIVNKKCGIQQKKMIRKLFVKWFSKHIIMKKV